MPRIDVVTCTRPDSDIAVYLGRLALQHAIDHMRLRGMAIDDLVGDDAVRTRVLTSLAVTDSVFFLGCGHGNEDVFTGQNLNRIFWTCDNVQLRGRVAYMLSCTTARRLGPDSVNVKGCVCYLSYDEVFAWIQDEIQDPLVDKYARGFFEPVLELIYRLADGYTAGEAFRASIDKWNEWIDYWSRSPDPLAPVVLMLLLHDRDCQKLIGDETARVSSAIPWPWWPLALALGTAPMAIVGGVVYTEEARKMGWVKV